MRRAATRISGKIPNAFDGDAHALLVAVYKDPRNSLEVRVDAAKAAIRYERPALQAVNINATLDFIDRLSHEDRITLEAALATFDGATQH
jgi:hypothetical protein